MNAELQEIRDACETDLYTFARVMFPDRYYGEVHKELFRYFQFGEASFKLALIPRDHQKSHCAAVYAAWKLTTKPWWTFLYVSANAGLVEDQLNVVKNILRSPTHRMLWPSHLNWVKDPVTSDIKHKSKDESTWRLDQFSIDHPDRMSRGVRDPSIRGVSVGSGKTGFHANELIFDDLVTDENYQSEADKAEVVKCYKNCFKILTTGAEAKAVGTRYGQDDLYAMMMELTIPEVDDQGVVTGQERLWECFERVVEDSPNRTGDGNFVWPRMQMPNGEWFGFDARELAIKKANLSIDGDIQGFYAQYYNDPNTSALHRINRNLFKYLDPRHLKYSDGWYYMNKKLKLICSMDLAFSKSGVKRRDYTAIAIVGIDHEGFLYVLEVERFQTDKLEVYYDKFMELLRKWNFRRAVVETNNGGGIVADYLQDMVRKEGGIVEIDGKPASNQQSKIQRIMQTLEPRYRNGDVYHTKGGFTNALEEELILPRPSNDDLKDAVALAVQELKRPLASGLRRVIHGAKLVTDNISRFGGARRRA